MPKKIIRFSSSFTLIDIPSRLLDIDIAISELLSSHEKLNSLKLSSEDKSLLFSYVHSLILYQLYSKAVKGSNELIRVIETTHPNIVEILNKEIGIVSL